MAAFPTSIPQAEQDASEQTALAAHFASLPDPTKDFSQKALEDHFASLPPLTLPDTSSPANDTTVAPAAQPDTQTPAVPDTAPAAPVDTSASQTGTTAVTPPAVVPPSQPTTSAPSGSLVAKARAAATKYGIDPGLFESLGHNENLDNPDAVSPAGAVGPYQLMPGTAQGLGVDPKNYDQNIDGAARYFKQMLDYYKGDTSKAVAAYNAGPGNVDAGNIPSETQAYIQRVLGGASTTKATIDVAGNGEASADTKLTTALDIANQQMGKPYVWGGSDPNGFDCSGLVQYAYGKAGIELPRTAEQQFGATTPVKQDQAKPGDLVFFSSTDPSHPEEKISHVGIYLGNGKMLNAPTEGSPVQVQSIASGFWADHIAGFGRVPGAGGNVAQNDATNVLPAATLGVVAGKAAQAQPTYNAPFSDQQQPVDQTVPNPVPGSPAFKTGAGVLSMLPKLDTADPGVGATAASAVQAAKPWSLDQGHKDFIAQLEAQAKEAGQAVAPIAQTAADLYNATPAGRVSAVASAAVRNPASAPSVALSQLTDAMAQMGIPRDLIQALQTPDENTLNLLVRTINPAVNVGFLARDIAAGNGPQQRLVDAWNATDPSLPPVQRVQAALASASAAFKQGGVSPSSDPTGGILAGLDSFVRNTVTDPTLAAGAEAMPLRAMAGGAAVGGIGAGVASRLSGATPEETASNTATGAGIGTMAGPVAESLAPLAGRAATLGAQGLKTLGEVGTEAGIVPGLSIKPVGLLDPRDASTRWTRAQVLAMRAGEPLDFQSEMLAEDLQALPEQPGTPEYDAAAAKLYDQYTSAVARDLVTQTSEKLANAQARYQGMQATIDPDMVAIAKMMKPVTADLETMTVANYTKLTGVVPHDSSVVKVDGKLYVNPDYTFDELAQMHGYPDGQSFAKAISDTRRQVAQIAALKTQVAQLRSVNNEVGNLAASYPQASKAGPAVDLSQADRTPGIGIPRELGLPTADLSAADRTLANGQQANLNGATGPTPAPGAAGAPVAGQQAPLGTTPATPIPAPGAAAAAQAGAGGNQTILPGVNLGTTVGGHPVPSVAGSTVPAVERWINEVVAPVRNASPAVQTATRDLVNSMLQAEIDGETAGLTASRALGKDDRLPAASLAERTGSLGAKATPEQQAFLQAWDQYAKQTGIQGRAHGYIQGDPVAAGTVKMYVPHQYQNATPPQAGLPSGMSLSPKGFYSQIRTFPTLEDAAAAGAKPLDSFSQPIRNYTVGVQTSEAKYQFVKALEASAPDQVMPFKAGDVLPAGWQPGMASDPILSKMAFSPDVARVLDNILSPSFLSKQTLTKAFMAGVGTSKETLFSLSGFHLTTELRQAYRANGAKGLPVIGRALWNTFIPKAYQNFRLADAPLFSEAARAGVTGLAGEAPDVGQTTQGIAGTAIRAATGGASAGLTTYQASKDAGADEQTSLRNGAIGAVIGAIAGPTLGRAINDGLWQRTVPTLKVLTYQIAKESGASAEDAAYFSNNTFGGQNLAALARSKDLTDFVHLTVLAPDWWESWANQIGNAFKGGAQGNLARGYWLRTAVVDGAVGLEALNLAISGHLTTGNEPGHQFDLETTGIYDKMGWDHTDPKTGVPYRTYWDILGPIRSMLTDAQTQNIGSFARSKASLPVAAAASALTNTDAVTGRKIIPPGTPPLQSAADMGGHILGSIAPIGISTGVKSSEPLPVTLASSLLGMRTSHSGYPAADPGTFLDGPSRDALSRAGVTLNLGPVGRSINGINLTPAEQERYQQLATQLTNQAIQKEAGRPQFAAYSSRNKQSAMQSVVDAARTNAATQVIQSIPTDEKKRRLAIKGGQTPAATPSFTAPTYAGGP